MLKLIRFIYLKFNNQLITKIMDSIQLFKKLNFNYKLTIKLICNITKLLIKLKI